MLVADKTKPSPTSCDAAELSQWPASVADRGGAEAIPDLSGGWVSSPLFCPAVAPAAVGLSCACAAVTRSEGKVRILAVCTAERLALLPEVPAMAESLPGFQATAWHGLFAPPGTPRRSTPRSARWRPILASRKRYSRRPTSVAGQHAGGVRRHAAFGICGVEEVRRRREAQDRLMRHQGGHRFRRCRPMGSTVWFIAAK